MGAIFSCSAETGANNPWPTIIMIAVVVLVIGAMYFLSNRSQKKRQEETEALLNAIKPGNKVKTIRGRGLRGRRYVRFGNGYGSKR